MKNIKTIIYLILISSFIHCKKSDHKELEQKQITDSISTKQSISTEIEKKVPENIDSEFDIFINSFNKDSTFQMSRIQFPITIKEVDDENYEIVEKIINLEDYEIIDLTYDESILEQEFNKYTQKTIIEGNKVTVEILGIDNGINCKYQFEKINGKWILITWSNLST